MSAEDCAEPGCSKNSVDISDTVPGKIITQEKDDVGSKATEPETDKKYFISEVIVEISETDESLKKEITILNENSSDSVLMKEDSESQVSSDQVKPQQAIHAMDIEESSTDNAIVAEGLPESTYSDRDPRRKTTIEERVQLPVAPISTVPLFAEDTEPQMYRAKGSLITPPIITKNMPMVFEYLPIHGRPQNSKNLSEFFSSSIREFVGCGLTDDEFQELEDYCSPEQLKTGNEIVMETSVPVMGVISGKTLPNPYETPENGKAPDLCIVKKHQMRIEMDNKGLYTKKLKYRGVRNLQFTQELENVAPIKPNHNDPDVDLEPGKDIIYRVRVYRPFIYNMVKERFTRTRHSVFCYDILLSGRNKLSDLRDRFVCHNDFDMRVDVSNHPDMMPNAKAKEVFPSGFLFINNVFYVDTREGCVDYSADIRDWARRKGLGVFPKRDMCAVRLGELVLKLGYPEVYVHQGNCEHVFLFSEVRLLGPNDPLRLYNYPCSTAIAQNQTVYCTTCAEFSAKWIVVGCNRVPFDPAFFCDACFRQYLYKDGQKVGDFKAYAYRGNALNVLKPQ